ncbi:MAG: zinc-binding alcohol dehydrogenase [Pseudomonadota bacterium]
MTQTEALWCVAPSTAEVRPGDLAGDGILVTTLFSGISRGTERLVFEGRVPESEVHRMRAPFQEGDFPFPVKYGYAAVVESVQGPSGGQIAFALAPHQTAHCLPNTALVPVPNSVPPERAILAANMETALNVLWDSGASAGDRIAVIGAGVVGSLVAYLCGRLPGANVTLVDINYSRASLAQQLGCAFASPAETPTDCDVVIHASASAAGLATALAAAGQEARVVEASWYGSGSIPIPLGGAFHSKRLQLIGSQVGQLPPDRAPRWNYRRRIETALALLADDRLDALISGETLFRHIAAEYGAILASPDTLCHRIKYD